MLLQHKIDIAHLHDINHYLTPSILPVLKKVSIPILWTLHDYLLICPESSFVSGNRICENCRGGAFYHCAIQKCKKGSVLASTLAAMESTIHHRFKLYKYIDYFLCPSRFLYNKFREFNFYPEKLILTNLCCVIQPGVPCESERYIIYVGRLAKVKGLITLLTAVSGLNIKLYIAGKGPEEDHLGEYISKYNITNAVLLGHKSKQELHNLVQKAEILVCPSEWYENFPYAIIEAMLLKTPVIASAIGGIPELVLDGQTGLLFEPANPSDLRSKITRLLDDRDLKNELTEKAFERTRSIVNYEHHYHVLKGVYARVGLEL